MSADENLLAVTILLNDEESASGRLHRLLPLVYAQLRAAAQQQMAGERAGHTLSATALVHEAYLKLIGPRDVPWQNRGHFYAAAAQAMRRILLDHAKARGRRKRSPNAQQLPLEAAATLAESKANLSNEIDLIALDEALCRLESEDPRMAHVVCLKYFTGLEISEVALALGISERTVQNDWAFAKAWLKRAMRDQAGED
jgi:RNA polymerase sigma-70 factor (ECF subfamily)